MGKSIGGALGMSAVKAILSLLFALPLLCICFFFLGTFASRSSASGAARSIACS